MADFPGLRELLCRPTHSPAYMTAFWLNLEFEVACEEHDRTLPGFMRTDPHYGDTWIPCGMDARADSHRFIERQRIILRNRAAQHGIDSPEMRDASVTVNRMPYARQREELARLRDTLSIGKSPRG